jgi:hypothetical protein
VPFLNKLLTTQEFDNSPLIWAGIILLLAIRVLINIFTRPILAILLTQSSPSRQCLGTINGANQALAALCRSAGPSVGGIVFSHSLEVGKPWIVWTGLSAFSIVVFIGGLFLRDPSHDYAPVKLDEVADESEEEGEIEPPNNSTRLH